MPIGSPINASKAGKEGEIIVQKSLWSRNYWVKDVSRLGLGYDLLINERFKVEVKTAVHSYKTSFRLKPDKFDVLAVVLLIPLAASVYYLKDKASLADMEISGGAHKITPEIIEKYFTKKPQEVFGNEQDPLKN